MEEARQHSALIDGATFGYATDHLNGMAVVGVFGLISFAHLESRADAAWRRSTIYALETAAPRNSASSSSAPSLLALLYYRR